MIDSCGTGGGNPDWYSCQACLPKDSVIVYLVGPCSLMHVHDACAFPPTSESVSTITVLGCQAASHCRYKDKGWAYHEGDPSDQRMLAAAAKRGVCLTSRSRPLRPKDMATFDYILGEPTSSLHLQATLPFSIPARGIPRYIYTSAERGLRRG